MAETVWRFIVQREHMAETAWRFAPPPPTHRRLLADLRTHLARKPPAEPVQKHPLFLRVVLK
jgi:hypothetical protein